MVVLLSTVAWMADSGLEKAICRDEETQKARKDAIPYERGLLPVPTSEFCTLLSPIPMLASAAARHSPPVNEEPSRLRLPLAPRHLNYQRFACPLLHRPGI